MAEAVADMEKELEQKDNKTQFLEDEKRNTTFSSYRRDE